jgi:hypothetical protein
MVNIFEFTRPIWVFIDFANEQESAAVLIKNSRGFDQIMHIKLLVISRKVKRLVQLPFNSTLDLLEYRGGFTRTSRALDGKHPLIPINFCKEISKEIIINLAK